jgi:hypothetical protein
MPHPFPTRLLAGALLVLQVAGCYSWRDPQAPWPVGYLAEHHPKHARVTVTPAGEPGFEVPPSTRVELLHPWVTADSVGGLQVRYTTWNYQRRPQAGEALAMARADITRVEVRALDPARTFLAGLAGAVAAFGVAMLIALAAWDGPMGSSWN